MSMNKDYNMDTNALDLNNHKLDMIPQTAYYVSEFITQEEESSILSNIYAAPKPKWTQLSNRRLQNWGGVPHTKGMIAEYIPPWLTTYLQKIHDLNLMAGKKPNHVLVNEYLPGQGIMPHLDGSLFYPTITTISLGSHTVLKFVKKDENNCLKDCFSILLEPRSLLVLQSELFDSYLHCIDEIKEDLLNNNVVNLGLCSSSYSKDDVVKRHTRISLTIRHVPKTSIFKLNIGNKLF